MKYSKKAPVKIVVLGAGGTGGYVIPHLYRLGYASEHPTRILVCDGDVVEQKNLIRQNFVEQDIGRNKAQVLAERYAAAFGIECEYRPEFIETQEELYTLTEPDRVPYPMEPQRVILLGCVDNNKAALPPGFRAEAEPHLHRRRQRGAYRAGGLRRPAERPDALQAGMLAVPGSAGG